MNHLLVADRADFLAGVSEYTSSYFPSLKTDDCAAKLSVVGLLGPAGAGKSTHMDLLVENTPDEICVSSNRTTRTPRITDGDRYIYYDLDKQGHRQLLLDGIADGSFLQIMSHPATQEIYGSAPIDYSPTMHNLTDIVPSEFYKLKQKDLYRRLIGAYLVPPSYETWQQRWLKRPVPIRPAEYKGRMQEAHDSMVRCLDDTSMPFLANNDLITTHTLLYNYITKDELWNRQRQAAGRNAAKKLLKGIVDSGILQTEIYPK